MCRAGRSLHYLGQMSVQINRINVLFPERWCYPALSGKPLLLLAGLLVIIQSVPGKAQPPALVIFQLYITVITGNQNFLMNKPLC